MESMTNAPMTNQKARGNRSTSEKAARKFRAGEASAMGISQLRVP